MDRSEPFCGLIHSNGDVSLVVREKQCISAGFHVSFNLRRKSLHSSSSPLRYNYSTPSTIFLLLVDFCSTSGRSCCGLPERNHFFLLLLVVVVAPLFPGVSDSCGVPRLPAISQFLFPPSPRSFCCFFVDSRLN